MPAVELKSAKPFLLDESDRCVACGLCLPHCPTYLKTRREPDSPRGRIALIRAMAKGDLPPSGRLETHLSLCLTCRACEAVCPSMVRYGKLIDGARALIKASRRPSLKQAIARRIGLHQLAASPAGPRRLGVLLYVCQRSGLRSLVHRSGLLRLMGVAQLEAQLPDIPAQTAWRTYYPATMEQRGNVALFTGCTGTIADRPALNAAIHLLNRLGYGVHVPRGQGCCGALHQHNGEPEKALELIRRNLECFDLAEVDAVISTSSGCGAMLAETDAHLPGDPRARALAAKVRDINLFLAETPWPQDLRPAPLAKTVAVHDPCSLSHVLGHPHAPYALLARIPKLRVVPMPENRICCGAAGVYHLRHPGMATRLRADKMARLKEIAPDILVTSNLGCGTYLGTGIRETRLNIEVMHPVVLIERQLQVASSK